MLEGLPRTSSTRLGTATWIHTLLPAFTISCYFFSACKALSIPQNAGSAQQLLDYIQTRVLQHQACLRPASPSQGRRLSRIHPQRTSEPGTRPGFPRRICLPGTYSPCLPSRSSGDKLSSGNAWLGSGRRQTLARLCGA